MIFTEEQQKVLELARTGKSFFLTGKAGTGKSTVLNELKKILSNRAVFLATTGVAASNIGGETVHSFFSIKPFGFLQEKDANWVKNEKRTIWQSIKTIIIDEVSMLRPDILDCINWTLEKNIGRTIKSYQLIFVGDMKQLMPVYKPEDLCQCEETYKGITWKYAKCIEEKKINIQTVELTEIKRQNDLEFIEALNQVREGQHASYFNDFKTMNKGIVLAPYNKQVSDYNLKILQSLPGEFITLECDKSDDYKTGSTIAEETLHLKDGCRVMYLKNDDYFYNGYLGTLRQKLNGSFELDGIPIDEHTWYTYKYDFKDGIIQPVKDQWIRQLPVKPAYALTIHKAQGLTFDEITVDLSRNTFAEGQLYTALSRVRTPQGLSIIK